MNVKPCAKRSRRPSGVLAETPISNAVMASHLKRLYRDLLDLRKW